MPNPQIDTLIACQDALMRAIDARDVAAIEKATSALAHAASMVQEAQIGYEALEQLQHALNQTTALKMRVNIMADWTRQRLDRLGELRGESAPVCYERFRKMDSIRPIL